MASAHDLQSGNAPSNIYHESQMARILKESKQFHEQSKSGSYKKILGDIQKVSIDAEN